MRRDFLFLAIFLPPDRRIRGKQCFVAPIDDDVRAALLELGTRAPGLQAFLAGAPNARLFGIGIRNDLAEEASAAQQAWHILSGIVDGYSLFLDATPPKICPYFLLREGDSPDAGIRTYAAEGTWISMAPTKPESKQHWEDVKSAFSQRLLKLFDIAAAGSQESMSPLLHQVLYSARMFRHGTESGVFGIDFLCKFSALEGLVCGSEQRRKKHLLTTRLGALFRTTGFAQAKDIERLWELRCTASHQAKAFELANDPDSVNHAAYIESVDRLFRGVLVFALDSIDTCNGSPQVIS